MIISQDTMKCNEAVPVEEFRAVDYVKNEVASSVKTLMRKVASEIPVDRGIISLNVDETRYKARLLFDSDNNRILELDEIIREDVRCVSFRDMGSHQIHELKITDGGRRLFLRLVEEVETGLMFLTGFLMNKKNVQKLY